MKSVATVVGLLYCLLYVACSDPADDTEQMPKVETVKYYDRNGDGKVDLERHRYPGYSDVDWELRDDDFNGNFEARWHYGVGLVKKATNAPVPTNVVMTP